MGKGRLLGKEAVQPVGTHLNVVVNGTVDLIAPEEATVLYIQAYGSSLRMTMDEVTNPFFNTGFILQPDGDILKLESYPGKIYKLSGTGAGVNVQWFKPLADYT